MIIKKIIIDILTKLLGYNAKINLFLQNDLWIRFQNESTNTSFDYAKKNMRNAICFGNSDSKVILGYGLKQVSLDGLFLEFGVHDGTTSKIIAKAIKPKNIHGFDSFYGLPEDWSGNYILKEDFNLNGKIPKLPKNVIIHKGLFSKTLPDFNLDNKIAFIHIDCDIYESTKTVFNEIKDRITNGTIIVFDEYFNYPNWQEHEFKAFQEYVKENQIKYTYLALTGSGKVCVKILGVTRQT